MVRRVLTPSAYAPFSELDGIPDFEFELRPVFCEGHQGPTRATRAPTWCGCGGWTRGSRHETGAAAGLTLYGDTLGPAGSDGATYLAMERHNADAMVRGFTAGRERCSIPGL